MKPLELSELSYLQKVWVEIQSSILVEQRTVLDIRPYGRFFVVEFTNGSTMSANSYGFIWRCWPSYPSFELRASIPFKGADA